MIIQPPSNPVPMPMPKAQPQKSGPLDPGQDRIVSLPGLPKYAYPAYGEKSAPTGFAEDRTIPVNAAKR